MRGHHSHPRSGAATEPPPPPACSVLQSPAMSDPHAGPNYPTGSPFTEAAGVGRIRFARLQRHFPTLAQTWRAERTDLLAGGLDARIVTAILARRAAIEPEQEIERLQRNNVRAITWAAPSYPARLRETYDPAVILYICGQLTPADEWCVTVVGTRKITAYGRAVAEEIAGDLARNRVTVVSGLACGADAIAHTAALDAGGRTLAIMASGLDIVYPPEHRRLADRISEAGALISDYPLGTEPGAISFPAATASSPASAWAPSSSRAICRAAP
ncbi:MAG: DNA-processing protein DprA [Dehalococcoidia bacterium]|nr:DNA-processing protein DprA [Dehalococcoidia bacterium]